MHGLEVICMGMEVTCAWLLKGWSHAVVKYTCLRFSGITFFLLSCGARSVSVWPSGIPRHVSR